jgi:hypothetical protein
MTIDKHTVALISIIGSSLDVIGAMYLAYDLLGGEHGPLRTLSRGVTYGALFGGGYMLAGGPVFGLVCGVAHGITLAWEYARASRGGPRRGFWYDAAMSSIRGAGFAVGSAYVYGWIFGATFGAASAIGQAIAYRLGIRPDAHYNPGTRPRITRFQFLAGINRTTGYAISGYISALAAGLANPLRVGLRAGVAIGLVTVLAGAFTPFIEWTADHVKEKTMGVFGVALILVGFALQSVQYWVALLTQ